MKKKVLSAVMALSMTSALLAGCGGQAASTAAPAAAAAPETEVSVAAEELSTAAQAETKASSVTVAAMEDPTNMSPWVARTAGWTTAMPEIYETLGQFDKLGGEFYGVLAKEWEFTSDDTVKVTLYDNIFDSQGNHFTANDAKFSMESCWAQGELAETAVIDEINVIDDFTFELKWKQPIGAGAWESFANNVYMVTQAAFEAAENGMVTDPVGTGPYVLSNYVAGSTTTLTARDDYWKSEDLRKVPFQYANVDEINVQVITETSQFATALQTGSIDASINVGSEDLAQFQNADGFQVYSYLSNRGDSLMANCSEDSPLHDINLRKAVFYAIDQDGVCALTSGGQNQPLASFGSVVYSDYDPKWLDGNFPYDVDAAKEYLAQSEYPDGVTLQMNIIAGNAASEEEALAIQEYLSQIGITLNLTTYPIAQYLPLEGDSTAWDLALNGFNSTYLVNCWAKFFDRNTIGRETTKNFVNDDELQALMDNALSLEGHNSEGMDAVMDYMQTNAIYKGLCVPYNNAVYNSGKLSSIVISEAGYLIPGAFAFN